jgi:cytochrome c peroxidase
MSTPGSAVFSPSVTCSATLPGLMLAGTPLTADNMARFQVPTLRNVDKRPYPNFVKAHGHNGYFKSLKSIVHFYNTRDVLRRCGTNDPGEATTCWPALESTASIRFRMKSRRLSTENTVVIFRGSGGGAHATHCS